MKRFTVDVPMDLSESDEQEFNRELVEMVNAFVTARTGTRPETVQVSAEDI